MQGLEAASWFRGSSLCPPVVDVKYVDADGVLSALRGCVYLKTSARLLASAGPGVLRAPETAYCLGCLDFYDLQKPLYARECARLGHRCSTCASCPQCGAVLCIASFQGGEGVRYCCRFCHWDSDEALGLRAPDRATLGKELQSLEAGSAPDETPEGEMPAPGAAFAMLLRHWKQLGTEWRMRKDQEEAASEGLFLQAHGVANVRSPWHLKDLVDDIEERSSKSMLDPLQESPLYQAMPFARATFTPDREYEAKGPPLRAACSGWVPREGASQRIPHRLPLLGRPSIRCRREREIGRPGILSMPKVDPMEGDSSRRSKVGNWWRLCATAVSFVPKLQVWAPGGDIFRRTSVLQNVSLAEHSPEAKIALTLRVRVSNPSETMPVCLRLGFPRGALQKRMLRGLFRDLPDSSVALIFGSEVKETVELDPGEATDSMELQTLDVTEEDVMGYSEEVIADAMQDIWLHRVGGEEEVSQAEATKDSQSAQEPSRLLSTALWDGSERAGIDELVSIRDSAWFEIRALSCGSLSKGASGGHGGRRKLVCPIVMSCDYESDSAIGAQRKQFAVLVCVNLPEEPEFK